MFVASKPMTRGVLFAAGLGTRLRPMTNLLPKPVVPFLDRPLAVWSLEHLARQGVHHIVANTHHLAEACERELHRYAGQLRFSREKKILGTGGGLRQAWEMSEHCFGRMKDDELLVAWNGDILFAPPLEPILRAHREANAMATMVLRETENPFALGAIEHRDGRVLAMLQKTLVARGRAAMFTGVHVFSRAALARLPVEGCVVRDGYVKWLADGCAIGATVSAIPWRDLGTPKAYLDAHLEVMDGHFPIPFEASAKGWSSVGSTVHPDARLSRCAIGSGAQIGDVTLTECVVWPGVRVDADHERCILLPDGRVISVER
jgi:mannose-1-phosphate guanylyltransferase